jgi:hypothetical protein
VRRQIEQLQTESPVSSPSASKRMRPQWQLPRWVRMRRA